MSASDGNRRGLSGLLRPAPRRRLARRLARGLLRRRPFRRARRRALRRTARLLCGCLALRRRCGNCGGRTLTLARRLDTGLQRCHEVDDLTLGLRLLRGDYVAALDLGTDDFLERLAVLVAELRRVE